MNRIIFNVTFVIGLLVVAWVGMGFVGTSALALAMTVVIAGVYVLGAWEVLKFRATTASLASALADTTQPMAELGAWLERVPAILRNAVRLRVEGERTALPGLALTPYLVGLLVMLGMLGTFLGMVVTFKGAVFALEGSTDLQAIRTALAAPIKGLGLSFGTSIAGVAASAMLGLLSALSRRERLDVVRLLDTRIATVLRPFSLAHQRQETFKALQTQANALPDVVDRLQIMMEGLERRSQQLNEQLLGQQAQFHREAAVAYTGLAGSVGGSLQDSLVAGARAAGESIKPVVEAAMAEMSQASSHMHQRVFDATQTQLNGLADSFGNSARTVADGWATALQQHARTSESQVEQLAQALQAFNGSFEQRAQTLLTSVQDAAVASRADLAAADQQRLQAWTQTLQTTATTLHGEWQQVGAQTLAQQQAVCETLEKTAGDVMASTSQSAGQALAQVGQLLNQSDALLRAHTEAEARWTNQQGERLDQLAGLWRTELAALRNDEATRGEAAVARVGELQTALTAQLSQSAEEVLARTGQQAGETLAQVAQLLAQSETLVQSHTEAETRWTTQQGERLDQLAGLWRTELAALRNEETSRGEAAAQRLGELHTTLTAKLAQDASDVLQRASQQGSQTLEHLAQLVTEAEALVSSRTESETRWTQQQGERLDQLAGLWRSELSALRAEEAARGEAAVERLGSMQTALTARLAQDASDVLQRAGQQGSDTLERLTQLVTEAEALVSSRTESEARWTEQQGERLDQLAGLWRSELSALRTEESARGEAAAERLGALQTTLSTQLTQNASEVLERTTLQTSQTLEQVAKLVTEAGALVLACSEFEEHATTQQGERMNELAALWRIELAALRDQEATHGKAAVARLGELQSAVTTHLATLGTALEAPMTRLMETAAAAPQAAAEVIAQLRQEMGHITERDNLALAERASLVESISTLLQSLNQASAEQRAAIDSLVAAASEVLDQAGGQFAQALDAQAEKTADVAAQVAGSAVELASLGDSFGHGVQLFSAANEKLVEGLQRMEGAIQQSSTRSDEQLAYYVAQAREVIDLSIASQQQVVEDLRRLRNPPANSVVLPVVNEGRAA